MVKRSLKASAEGIIKAKQSFELRQWSQEYLASEVGVSTRNPIWKFFSGRPLDRHIFMEICFKLDLDWEEIADLPTIPKKEKPKSIVHPSEKAEQKEELVNNNEDLVTLKEKLRGLIKSQCFYMNNGLNINQKIPVCDLYIDLEVYTSIRSQRWLDIYQLNKNNNDQLLSSVEEKTTPAIDIVQNNLKSIFIGKSGSGKSIFLKYLANQCIDNKFKNDCIPLFISLKILAQQTPPEKAFHLLEYIQQTWKIFGISSSQIESLVREGKILLLLDELEEITLGNHQNILAEITQFTTIYYQCPIVTTCRSGTNINQFLPGFHTVELADFNSWQKEIFVNKWFLLQKNKSNQEITQQLGNFFDLLKRPKYELIEQLSNSPLFLFLLCSIFQELKSFPSKLSLFYQEAIDILLNRTVHFSSSSSAKIASVNQLTILTDIAKEAMGKNNFYYEKKVIIKVINKYINKFFYDNLKTTINADNILSYIVNTSGLLVENARGIYSFSCSLFQEYFMATEIVKALSIESTENQLQQFANYINEPRYHSLLFLILEMLSEPTFLIKAIEKQINKNIEKHKKLKSYFQSLMNKAELLQKKNINLSAEGIIAFYLGVLEIKDLNLANTFEPKIATELPNELALDIALVRSLILAEQLSQQATLEELLELGFALDLENKYKIDTRLNQEFQRLKNELFSQASNSEQLLSWWENNASQWINQLRELIIEYRSIGQDWQFNQEEKNILQQYYHNSLFLKTCIDRITNNI